MMMKLMNWLMLSCKKATGLIEKQSLIGLSAKEKFRLRIHTTMCDGCKAYLKQSIWIDKALHHHLEKDTEESIPYLQNKELQDRIIANL